jgi:hypothetical protein
MPGQGLLSAFGGGWLIRVGWSFRRNVLCDRGGCTLLRLRCWRTKSGKDYS